MPTAYPRNPLLLRHLIILLLAPLAKAFSQLDCADIYWADATDDSRIIPIDQLCINTLGCACLPARAGVGNLVGNDKMMCLRPQYDGYTTPEDIELYAIQVGACRMHCKCGREEGRQGRNNIASLEDGIERIEDVQNSYDWGADREWQGDFQDALADCGNTRCWGESDCEPVRAEKEGCEDVLCVATKLKATGYRKQRLVQKYGVGRCKHSDRRKRGLEGESCVCNASYVSESCCGVMDGIVWEDPGLGHLI